MSSWQSRHSTLGVESLPPPFLIGGSWWTCNWLPGGVLPFSALTRTRSWPQFSHLFVPAFAWAFPFIAPSRVEELKSPALLISIDVVETAPAFLAAPVVIAAPARATP